MHGWYFVRIFFFLYILFQYLYDMLIEAYVEGSTNHLKDCKETARHEILR